MKRTTLDYIYIYVKLIFFASKQNGYQDKTLYHPTKIQLGRCLTNISKQLVQLNSEKGFRMIETHIYYKFFHVLNFPFHFIIIATNHGC